MSEQKVSEKVAEMERTLEDLLWLTGEMLATLMLPANMEELCKTKSGYDLINIAQQWKKRFQKIQGEKDE